MLTARRGAAIAELLVALVLAAIVLGAATGSLLRQQRSAGRMQSFARADEQLRAATALLPGELHALAPGTGDVVHASDTALQLRAPVGVGLACATESGAVTLVPPPSEGAPWGGLAGAPHAGDTLWWLDSTSGWRPRAVTTVAQVAALCTAPIAAGGTSWRLVTDSADLVPAGTPVRITRHARYSVYRAGDGSWQLGVREALPNGSLAGIQPAAGPFLARDGPDHTGFRHYDSAGSELRGTGGVPLPLERIARVRAVAITGSAAGGATGAASVRRDSADAALANGRP